MQNESVRAGGTRNVYCGSGYGRFFRNNMIFRKNASGRPVRGCAFNVPPITFPEKYTTSGKA